MRALLIQPPFTQLNSPYPAVYYLESFLRSRGVEARTVDHSIELYRTVFSRAGLAPAFEAARSILGETPSLDAPRRDRNSLSQLERYVSYENLYLEWIEGLVAFLSGKDPALAHALAQAVELPMGMRTEAFIEARGGRIDHREARGLATAMLEDLGDLVSYAFDPHFGTVRYGERIASSARRFADLRSALDASPLLEAAYLPLLEAEWKKDQAPPDLLLISLPFPGCLLGALACARSAREAFGASTRVLFGGGYVSTELRSLRDGGIFDFCDYLSFDSGYGSLDSILEVEAGAPPERLYKTMYRDRAGRIVAGGFEAGDPAAEEGEKRRVTRCDEAQRLRASEREALASVAPDYSGADFGRYLQVVDSDNPMHNLWSDSPWLKYSLARGCYWRRCAFCDTALEYVSLFVPAKVPAIARAAGAASARTGLYGIHFVDEAMPMASLLAFARSNRARAAAGLRPFHFWGNVRFDSSWTEDRCEYLAASGLVAVSGGIEIATEGGLEMTDKGFDFAGLVQTLVAMRRSGLLVHAYLIYGFPGQSREDIADSAEACRQLFASGLVDSAFWHRFVLTRGSRMYGEWKAGGRPSLRPQEASWDFANNDLSFAGEGAYDEFDGPLAATLEAWMSGEGLDSPAEGQLEAAGLRAVAHARGRDGQGDARDGSDRRVGDRRVGDRFVEDLVARAEARLDSSRRGGKGRAHWIAGTPLALPAEGGDAGQARLTWTYRGETRELAMGRGSADALARKMAALAVESEGRPFDELEAELAGSLGLGKEALGLLRESGLVVV